MKPIQTNIFEPNNQKVRIIRLMVLIFSFAATDGGYVYCDELQQQRIDFVKAEVALKSGRRSEYNRLLGQLDQYPLAAYLRYQGLKNQIDDSAAVKIYLKRYEGSRYARLLRKRLLNRFAATGQWREFLDHYREYNNVKLQCNYYRALYFVGRKTDSMQGAHLLWLSGDSRPDECDSLFSLLRKSALYSVDLVWRRFALALENGNLGLAKYLQQYLFPKYRAAARSALDVHKNPMLIGHCPGQRSSNPVDGWIFAHAIERMADKNLVKAIALWDARSDDYSIDSAARHRVKKRLAMLAALRRHPFAYARFEGIEAEATDRDIRFWRIRAALTTKNWDQVSLSINQLPTDEKGLVQWKYWLARALEGRNKNEQARKLFLEVAKERDYYGFLAADHIGQGYQFADRPIDLNADEMIGLAKLPHYAVVRELLTLGRDIEARRNWWHMLAGMTIPEKTQAAKVAEKWGLYQVAVFTAAKAQYWDDLRLRFPVLFARQIIHNAKANSLSPSMVFGLVRQESVFDDAVVSGAGAIGLMQIMPATGKQIARQIHQRWRSKRVLFDPDTNLRYGAHYLRDLLDRFGQNFAMAAAGYNAGPHRVKRWLPVNEALAADIWVEIIPYRETRRYVRYVLGYTIVYQFRLNSGEKKIRHYMPVVPPDYSAMAVAGTLQNESPCH